jgi:hypothetical protein
MVGFVVDKMVLLQVLYFSFLASHSANEAGGSRYKLPGSGGMEKGPGPDYVAYVIIFFDGIIIC